MFKDLGAVVLDADKIAHQLLKPGRPCFCPVVNLLGDGILTRGRIDRAKVAKLVFEDARKLKALEKIIHPQVAKEMRARVAAARKGKRKKAVVLDVPLLIEAGLDQMVDLIVVVSATRSTQVQRSVKRLRITRAEALRRMNAQMPIKEKRLLADRIIDNRGSRRQTRAQVKDIWNRLIINS